MENFNTGDLQTERERDHRVSRFVVGDAAIIVAGVHRGPSFLCSARGVAIYVKQVANN
jgi:hypothetical protein